MLHLGTGSYTASTSGPRSQSYLSKETPRRHRIRNVAPPRQCTAGSHEEPCQGRGTPTQLRLLLDSASTSEWKRWMKSGMFTGITTNPTILQKDGVECSVKSLTDLSSTAFDMGAKEIHLQTWGETSEQMLPIALKLADINRERVVVKLPCTFEGLKAAAVLRDNNIRVTMTGLYYPKQVVMAQTVGAEYAAPYLGRMNDAYGENEGTKNVLQMQRMIDEMQSKMRLLVASVRDPTDMTTLCAQGCNTFTISPATTEKLVAAQLTDAAAADFLKAAYLNGGSHDLERAGGRA